jgi:transposase
MREIRSSGSAEGVMSNHDPYSDFDSNSLWVCARRMEQGRLHWPTSEDGRVQLTREEFALLIGGIDLTATTKRKWYRKPIAEKDTISQITA